MLRYLYLDTKKWQKGAWGEFFSVQTTKQAFFCVYRENGGSAGPNLKAPIIQIYIIHKNTQKHNVMKRRIKDFHLYLLIIGGLLLIAGCAKDDTDPKNLLPDATTRQIKDIDGNNYDTVHIGGQVWLKQNLTTTRLNDGTKIETRTDGKQWGSLNGPGYCWYNNDSIEYGTEYGALYNMYAVNTGKLCPDGWRVPTIDDLTHLIDYLGGAKEAAIHMQSTTHHWSPVPNHEPTNASGFTALPGGWRFCNDGEFQRAGLAGLWWTSTIIDEGQGRGYAFHLFPGWDIDISEYDRFHYGNSVRCI